MTLTGFSLPELSAFDPPVEGEGSIDPMGLAAISDRLADLSAHEPAGRESQTGHARGGSADCQRSSVPSGRHGVLWVG